MGGIALILSLIAVAILVGGFVALLVLRGGARQGRRLAESPEAPRPRHDAPHPEQAERERGTLFPPASA
jgi:hypothetical protein